MAPGMMMRLSEDVLAMVVAALRDKDKLMFSCASRELRFVVTRSARIALRASADAWECFAVFPATVQLTAVGFTGDFEKLARLTSLTLECTRLDDSSVLALRALTALRSLSLARCTCASLDLSALPLDSLTISKPTGSAPAFGALTTLTSVSLEAVSFATLGSLATLPSLRSLSFTAPYRSSSHERPIATIGTFTTLTTLSLYAVEAIVLQLWDLRNLRLTRLRADVCSLCGDDAFLLHPSIARASGHDCAEYTRRMDLTPVDVASGTVQEIVDTLARAAEPSDYECYIHRRLACPLMSHHHGLRNLFLANLAQFDDTYRVALTQAVPLLMRADTTSAFGVDP
jgi:hypothetical protein